MPKRKRDGRVIGQNGPSEEERKRSELERQIQLGKRQLTRNLRLAKGFERQKLGRREKEARAKNDDNEAAKIEAEIQALKKVDIPTSAEHHLYKTLHKTKGIKNSNLLPTTVQLPSKTNVDIATSNVIARMYNAKLVKDAMVQTLIAIRFTIGIEGKEIPDMKQTKTGKKEEPSQKKQTIKETQTKAVPQRSPTFSPGSEDEEAHTDDSGEVTLTSESDSSDVEPREVTVDGFDSDAYAAFEARLASTSSEDEDSEILNSEQDSSVAAALESQIKRELLASIVKSGQKTSATTPAESAGDALSIDSGSMADVAQLDGSSDLVPVERPAKTASVARRMIFSHLGIKQLRTDGSGSTNVSGQDTSTEDDSQVSVVSSVKCIASPGSAMPSINARATLARRSLSIAVESSDERDKQGLFAEADGIESVPPSKRVKTTVRSSSLRPVQSDEDVLMAERKPLPPPRLARSARRAALRESIPVQEDNTSSESDAAISISKSKDDKIRASKEDTKRLKKEEKAALKAQKSAKSTFLPSLADGAYWSGSESAPSDIEEHVAPRKNRRGQRARQAIAEKKHGKAAKHLQASTKKKEGRDDGWDLKRGATSRDDGWRKGKGAMWKGTDANGISGSNAVPVTAVPRTERKKTKDDEGPLHPSWEAKKNAKGKEGIVPFKGKKITFD